MSSDKENKSNEGNISKENENTNKLEPDIEKMLRDIQNSINLKDTIANQSNTQAKEGTTGTSTTTTEEVPFSEVIAKTAANLTAINLFKTELCKLPLEFYEREYYNNCVLPLAQSFDFLSRTSFNLASSVNILTNSPIVPVKKSEIKDTIELMYRINSQCEDVYKVLRKRVYTLMECRK